MTHWPTIKRRRFFVHCRFWKTKPLALFIYFKIKRGKIPQGGELHYFVEKRDRERDGECNMWETSSLAQSCLQLQIWYFSSFLSQFLVLSLFIYLMNMCIADWCLFLQSCLWLISICPIPILAQSSVLSVLIHSSTISWICKGFFLGVKEYISPRS